MPGNGSILARPRRLVRQKHGCIVSDRPGPKVYSIAAHRGFADALVAGLFAACGFLLMQKGFELYLAYFPSITLVYGAFATVPIFLLWLYLSWATVLLGALVAATLLERRSAEAVAMGGGG